jgi:hypothetical protein
VRNVELRLGSDPGLLTIAGVTAGAGMPAGATATLDTTTLGVAIVSFTSPVDLPAGSGVFANLQANVPAANGGANYHRQQVLDIRQGADGIGRRQAAGRRAGAARDVMGHSAVSPMTTTKYTKK